MSKSKNLNDALPSDVANKYEVVYPERGGNVQYFGSKFGTIDFSKLTLKKAKALVDAGFKRLRKKESSSSSKKSSSSTSSKSKK